MSKIFRKKISDTKAFGPEKLLVWFKFHINMDTSIRISIGISIGMNSFGISMNIDCYQCLYEVYYWYGTDMDTNARYIWRMGTDKGGPGLFHLEGI